MLKLFLWLRYLHKKKIVFLSIVAVALSAALLIVVASLFTGYINAIEQSAVEAVGDVVVAPPMKLAKYPVFIEHLRQLGAVSDATPVLSGQGLLHLGQGRVRAVKILGIEPVSRANVTGFKQSLYKQKNQQPAPSFRIADLPEKTGGFVGIGVLAEPDEKTDAYDFKTIEKMLGSEAVITTGTASQTQSSEDKQGSGAGDDIKKFKRKSVQFTIKDIVFTGVYDLDKEFVYLPIEEVQKVLYPNEEGQIADQIQIKLKAGVPVDSAMAQIRGVFEEFAEKQLGWESYLIANTDIVTAQYMQRQYVAEIRKQLGILLLIFGVVSFSAVVLVFCIFYMIVMTKQKDIAVIKSCGAASGAVAMIFAGFGACVGIIGSGVGTALGYVVTKNINVIEKQVSLIFGLKLWESSVYMFSRIPNDVDWHAVVPIVLAATAGAVIGSLIPAVIAVRTRPVEILRYE